MNGKAGPIFGPWDASETLCCFYESVISVHWWVIDPLKQLLKHFPVRPNTGHVAKEQLCSPKPWVFFLQGMSFESISHLQIRIPNPVFFISLKKNNNNQLAKAPPKSKSEVCLPRQPRKVGFFRDGRCSDQALAMKRFIMTLKVVFLSRKGQRSRDNTEPTYKLSDSERHSFRGEWQRPLSRERVWVKAAAAAAHAPSPGRTVTTGAWALRGNLVVWAPEVYGSPVRIHGQTLAQSSVARECDFCSENHFSACKVTETSPAQFSCSHNTNKFCFTYRFCRSLLSFNNLWCFKL